VVRIGEFSGRRLYAGLTLDYTIEEDLQIKCCCVKWWKNFENRL